MTRTYRRCPYRPCWTGDRTFWLFKAWHKDHPRRLAGFCKDDAWKQGRVWLHFDGARCDAQWRRCGEDLRVARRQALRQQEWC